MYNDWLVQYTKHLLKLQSHPNRRYKRICGRISDGEIDQILATLGGEPDRFRNETVALSKEVLEVAPSSGKTEDLEVGPIFI